jgi:hypothetical protein
MLSWLWPLVSRASSSAVEHWTFHAIWAQGLDRVRSIMRGIRLLVTPTAVNRAWLCSFVFIGVNLDAIC